MPQIEIWAHFPPPIRRHLIERMHDRSLGLDDLNQLRLWIEPCPKTFLLANQPAEGTNL